jgi:hypothetical protein
LTRDKEIVWRIDLPVEVYGAGRGRVSVYRMAAVAPQIVSRLQANGSSVPTSRTSASPASADRVGGLS